MGIFDRKANRVWNDLDKYYGELVAGLPDTDGLGKPLDKPRIRSYCKTRFNLFRG